MGGMRVGEKQGMSERRGEAARSDPSQGTRPNGSERLPTFFICRWPFAVGLGITGYLIISLTAGLSKDDIKASSKPLWWKGNGLARVSLRFAETP